MNNLTMNRNHAMQKGANIDIVFENEKEMSRISEEHPKAEAEEESF
jgi:hypothetical protein